MEYDSSITYCSNENCSKKESCLRYTKKIYYMGKLICLWQESNVKRINVISIKMNIIDEVPNDDLEKKMLLQSNQYFQK